MRNTNLGILILRLSIGILMLLHGIAKLNSINHIKNMLNKSNLPDILAYGVFIGEIIAPLLIIIGYRTRLASLIFCINCLFIIYLGGYSISGLTPYGGWSAKLPGLFLFGGLALFFTGGGAYSLSRKKFWD